MGRGDAGNAKRFADVVAVCDVDDNHAAEVKHLLADGSKSPETYKDFRKVLERPDIHAVINATPDHWHTLINIAASRAGKDVYGEKPLTLTIDEGRHVVKAVREHKIVFQTGTQQRSSGRFRLACELVRNGRIGKLQQVTVWLPAGLRDGPFSSTEVPAQLDWNVWQGQTPAVDYVKQRCHQTFRFWYCYSGGTMTDWGAHHNDIALWAIGLPGPVEIEGQHLTDPIPGGYTAFSQYEVHFTYANGVRHTVKTTPDDSIYGSVVKENGQRNGIKFEGSDGWIWVNREEIETSDPDLVNTPPGSGAIRLQVSNDHMGNFFDCVKSRQSPVASVEIGHRGASVCHLGNISLRLGRKLKWNPDTEKFIGDHDANRWLAREMRAPFDYHMA
jgi:predicted dehydrogenase